jgi:glycosyltransferase involved in cell wall biosynthesis
VWSYVPVEHDPALIRRALAGDLKLIAWGNPVDVALYEWRTGLRFAYIVDTTWPLWGTRAFGRAVRSPEAVEAEDPATTAVACFFYRTPSMPLVTAFLEARGMPWFLPLPPVAMGRLLGPIATSGVVEGGIDPIADAARLPPLDRALQTAAALPSAVAEEKRLADLLARVLAGRPPRPVASGRVDLLLSGLFAGGAERQMCNLAVGLQRAGWSPRLVTMEQIPVEALHYEGFLLHHGIPHVVMPPFGANGNEVADRLRDPAALPAGFADLLRLLDSAVAIRAAQAARFFAAAPPPELLVCYLDWANTAGALGALAADVPHVLISGRNVAPRHFPHFYAAALESFHRLYRLLRTTPRVRLSCNSAGGAADYADWLNVPAAEIAVVPNAVDIDTAALPPVDPGAGPLRVLGVFRLAPEKRPEVFVEIIDRLRRAVPGLQAVICGDGSERGRIVEMLRDRDLQSVLTLPGIVGDVPAMMARSALMLHVAAQEGMPNAILEAQALGLPVVATDVGGTGEALAPALAAHLHAPDDLDGLERSCLALLADPDRRRVLGARARAETLARFSLPALVEATLTAGGAQPVTRRRT